MRQVHEVGEWVQCDTRYIQKTHGFIKAVLRGPIISDDPWEWSVSWREWCGEVTDGKLPNIITSTTLRNVCDIVSAERQARDAAERHMALVAAAYSTAWPDQRARELHQLTPWVRTAENGFERKWGLITATVYPSGEWMVMWESAWAPLMKEDYSMNVSCALDAAEAYMQEIAYRDSTLWPPQEEKEDDSHA